MDCFTFTYIKQVIVIKSKPNSVFRADTKMLHTKKVTTTKVTYFSNILYHIKYHKPSLSTTTVVATLQIRMV